MHSLLSFQQVKKNDSNNKIVKDNYFYAVDFYFNELDNSL